VFVAQSGRHGPRRVSLSAHYGYDGLQRHTASAGGLTLYNPQYPQGREILHSRNENDNEESSRTDFFMAFTGLWEDIRRIHLERDEVAAHNSVLRAIDDVRTVLAIYASAQSRQWESTY
jgi:hypothetical protein